MVYKLCDQACDGLRLTRAGRALNDQLIGFVERVQNGLLRRVECVDINKGIFGNRFVGVEIIQLDVAVIVIGVEVDRAVVGDEVRDKTVDQSLIQDLLKVALNGVGVSRELAHNNVVYQLERSARVVREGLAGIFGELFEFIAVVFNANIVGSVKIKEILQEGIGIDLLGHTVGHRGGNAVELEMRQDQRAVVNNVTRGVECDRNRGRVSVKNDREEAQRSADAKFTVGKAALHKGIADIKIVLTLVAHIACALTNEVDKILVSLASGIGAGQILVSRLGDHHRLGSREENIEGIVTTVCIKKVNRIFCRQLGQEEHTVCLVDVDKLFGKLAQRFFNVIRNLCSTFINLTAVDNGEEFGGKVLHKSRAHTANAIKVRGLLRHQTNHLAQSVIGANRRGSARFCFFAFSYFLTQKVERIKEFKITFHSNNPSFIQEYKLINVYSF